MPDQNLIITPIAKLNTPDILGEYVKVTGGEIPRYPTPFTGPEFEEGIMRVLYANLDAFGWVWITNTTLGNYKELLTSEDIDKGEVIEIANRVNLNDLKITGAFTIMEYENYIPGVNIHPINIFTQYIGGIFYMVSTIGTDIYYRIYSPEDDYWSPWYWQSFCNIITSLEPPTEFGSNDLWLEPPNGDRQNFTLYAYINGEWVDLSGTRVMSTAIYDKNHVERDIYEYTDAMLRKHLCVLTERCGALKLEHLLYSEYYTKVAFILEDADAFYFYINPEDIMANPVLDQDSFYIVRYDKETKEQELTKGLPFNIRFMEKNKYGRIYLVNDNGKLYESRNFLSWSLLENFSPYLDYQSLYEPITCSIINGQGKLHPLESIYDYNSIYFMKALDTQYVYFFTENQDFIIETLDHQFYLMQNSGIPDDYEVKDLASFHGVLYAIGYNKDGTPDTRYYVSYDNGITWQERNLPYPRKWSHIYISDGKLIFTTDDPDDEFESHTICIDYPGGLISTVNEHYVRQLDRLTVHQVMNLRKKGEIDYWENYKHGIGGKNVIQTGQTLIKFEKESEPDYPYPTISFVTDDKVLSSQTVEFPEYKGLVHGDSFTKLTDTSYGFIVDEVDENGNRIGLGFQQLHYVSYIEAFDDHIHNMDIHLTPEDRELMLGFILRKEYEELLKKFTDALDEHTLEELKKLIYDNEFENAKRIVDTYVEHRENKDIHLSKAEKDIFNSKADGDHTHFFDDRVRINTTDIVEGRIPLHTVPKEALRRMIKVDTIGDMLGLDKDKDHVYNGTCIRVLSISTRYRDVEPFSYGELNAYTWEEIMNMRMLCTKFKDAEPYTYGELSEYTWDAIMNMRTMWDAYRGNTMFNQDLENFTFEDLSYYTFDNIEKIITNMKYMLVGRFFWVIDQDNLSSMDSYLEFTMTDTINIYWEEVLNKVSERDQYGILDVPNNIEIEHQLMLHDKSQFGYEFLAAEKTEAKLLQQMRIEKGEQMFTEYKVENPPQNLCEKAKDMICFIDNNVESMLKLDMEDIPLLYGLPCVMDIQYSPETRHYYIYQKNEEGTNFSIATYDNNFNLLDSLITDNTHYSLQVIMVNKNVEWVTCINPIYCKLNNLLTKQENSLPSEITTISKDAVFEIKYIDLNVRQFVFINAEFKMGIIRFFDTGEYEYRMFTKPLTDIIPAAKVVSSIWYDVTEDLLTITIMTSSTSAKTIQYKYFSSLFMSFECFDDVDGYINGVGYNQSLDYLSEIPERIDVTFNSSFSVIRYHGKWERRHIFTVYKGKTFYLAISDDFYKIPYVTAPMYTYRVLETLDEKWYNRWLGEYFNVDIVPYEGKTYALIWYDTSALYLRYGEEVSRKIYIDSDMVAAVDISNESILTNDAKSELAIASIPHVFSSTGIRYCNGNMYLFGYDYTLIQFSTRAFFNQNIRKERILIMNHYKYSENEKCLPLQSSMLSRYHVANQFFGVFGVSLNVAANLAEHTVINSASEYEVSKSLCLTRICESSARGVTTVSCMVNCYISFPINSYWFLYLNHKGQTISFDTILKIQPDSNASGYYICSYDVYSVTINTIVYITIAVLRTNASGDCVIDLYRIQSNEVTSSITVLTPTTIPISYNAKDGENWKPVNLQFNLISGYLLFSQNHEGIIILYPIDIYGNISTTAEYIYDATNRVPIEGTSYTTTIRSLLMEGESERYHRPDRYLFTGDDCIGESANLDNLMFVSLRYTRQNGIEVNGEFEFSRSLYNAIYSSEYPVFLRRVVIELPSTKVEPMRYVIVWNQLAPESILYMYDVNDIYHYYPIYFPEIDTIYDISYIHLTNTAANEEDYGIIVMEAKTNSKVNANRLETINGQLIHVVRGHHDIYYFMVSSSAIIDTFNSNFAQLQMSSSSVYAKIDNKIKELEQIF